MLIIRKAQMLALDAAQRRQFVVDLSAALQDQYPGMRRACTAEGFLAAVEQCVDDSQAMGFDARGEIAQYVMLCLLFGRHFTSDPLLPWSADSLRYAGPARMPHLTAAAEFHTRCVSGAGNRFLLRAVERWLFAVVAMSASATPMDLAELYPEKAAVTSTSALREFLSVATETIRVRNLREPVARDNFVACALLLGHRCHEDPFLETIRPFFAADPRTVEQDRLTRLQAAVLDVCRGRIPHCCVGPS